jgi:hypothetical protein
MAKRFTDSEKWSDPWFLSLKTREKLFWLFLIDRCDHAGIWKASWTQVRDIFGGLPDIRVFQDRMYQIGPETYFLPKFLTFQYGYDWKNSKVLAVRSAVKILREKGLIKQATRLTLRQPLAKGYLTLRQPLANPCLTHTDTDTDTDTDQDTVMDTDKDSMCVGGGRS